jgi:hypothetical protein
MVIAATHAATHAVMMAAIKLAIALLAICATPALAKDLTNRLGVGYSDQMSINLPSITVRYYPDPDLGLSAALGVDTQENASKFGFLAKVYKVVFMEDNLNFFMGASAGVISQETGTEPDTKNESGFELAGIAGCEFFFTGLDSLGFTVETGVGISSISSSVRFRTIGDSPVRGGVVFYF